MRNLFQAKLDTTNNIVIRNPLSIDWSSFPYESGFTLHNLTDLNIIKPYTISLEYYGSTNYEDILLLLNNIENIFDCVPEKEIKIPNFQELKTWLSQYQAQAS